MEEEIWKDIKGYEGLYQISNLGNVKSLKRITTGKKYGKHNLKEKILKFIKSGKYYSVHLCKNGKRQATYVHRLVGIAFLENENNYLDINHKDGDTKNNNVENLEWCNRSYNIKHSYKVLKRTANTKGFIDYIQKRKRKINQYDLQGNFIKEWGCISEAEKFLNQEHTGKICECCKHKHGRKSAFGYKWEYSDNTIIPK